MRKLPTALKEYIDTHLILPETPPVTPTDWMIAAALACVGVHNLNGADRGPVVELFQSVVGFPQSQPWCLDFIQGCIAYAEDKTGVLSPLPATELCMALWNQAPASQRFAPPRVQAGDLILWRFGATLHGHCGIVRSWDSLCYHTVEGNTSDKQEIDRLGDGVWTKNRAKGGSKTFVEVGFLRPF